VQLSPFSLYFIPLRCKYSPQHPGKSKLQSVNWRAAVNNGTARAFMFVCVRSIQECALPWKGMAVPILAPSLCRWS
jgi:hypothetical protein